MCSIVVMWGINEVKFCCGYECFVDAQIWQCSCEAIRGRDEYQAWLHQPSNGGEGKVGMGESEQRSGGEVMGGYSSIRGHRCSQVKYEELTPWWNGGMLISYDVNDWHWRV